MSAEVEGAPPPEPPPGPADGDEVDASLLTPRQPGASWDEIPPEDDGRMSLVGHLEELRSRILTSLLTLFLAACGCYSVSDRILGAVTRTAGPGQKFVFLSPTEAFFTHLSVSFYAGLLLAAPVLIYQVWAFVRPGLTARERHASRMLFPVIAFFFVTGAAFAYFGILPLGIQFLLGFATDDLVATLSIQAYSTFVLTFLLVFGGAFELPVAIFFAARTGLISVEDLVAFRPHIVVGIFIAAAVLTPPDVVTQLLLGIPLWLLYEATILLLRVLP